MIRKFIRFLRKTYSIRKFEKCGKNLKILGKIHQINNNVLIGENVTLYPNVSFEGNGEIVIGNNVKIGTNVIISSHVGGGVYIGDYSSIAGNSYLIDCDHGTVGGIYIQKQPLITEKIYIGKDVWISAGVVIGKGSVIKDGAVVGANSFLKGIAEENCIYVGTPARKLRGRL